MYQVYIIYSLSSKKYYKGQTKDLEDRLRRHNSGYELSTKNGKPWKLIWSTEKPTRSEALALERKLKNMNRNKLEEFIRNIREVRAAMIPKSGYLGVDHLRQHPVFHPKPLTV